MLFVVCAVAVAVGVQPEGAQRGGRSLAGAAVVDALLVRQLPEDHAQLPLCDNRAVGEEFELLYCSLARILSSIKPRGSNLQP